MSFSGLASDLTLLGESPRQSGFSYNIPSATSTVVVFLVMFFIIRLNYTFVNRLSYFHTLKYVNRFLKSNRLAINALYLDLFRPDVRHTV